MPVPNDDFLKGFRETLQPFFQQGKNSDAEQSKNLKATGDSLDKEALKTKTPPTSVGELRVRTSFNPSELDTVSQVKQKSAELINLMQDIKTPASVFTQECTTDILEKYHEKNRLVSLAQTAYEEAAMWAVKALTFK